MESHWLSTIYPLKLWIVYKIVDNIVKIRKNKKGQINIDFPDFFGIMISDAFIINKGGVSTWRWHFSRRRDPDPKFTDSEQEWAQKAAEKYLQPED